MVLRIVASRDKERLQMCDCGTQGDGSKNGAWLDGEAIPKACWYDVSDNAELFLGIPHNNGLALFLKIYRDPDNKNLINSVRIERGDGLHTHHYIIVHRLAGIGFGDCAISLGESETPIAWGRVSLQESPPSFLYEKLDGSPLKPAPLSLKPGDKITGLGVEILTCAVTDGAFTVIAPKI
jgi:hypothetical protein